jgi:hypothetical protein
MEIPGGARILTWDKELHCAQKPRSLTLLGMTMTNVCLNEQALRMVESCDPVYDVRMRYSLRFLWNATKGHRLAPWRSPYLLWRMETYCGVKMTQIGFIEFWEFLWRERSNLWRFLKWTGEMERYAHPKPRNL